MRCFETKKTPQFLRKCGLGVFALYKVHLLHQAALSALTFNVIQSAPSSRVTIRGEEDTDAAGEDMKVDIKT